MVFEALVGYSLIINYSKLTLQRTTLFEAGRQLVAVFAS